MLSFLSNFHHHHHHHPKRRRRRRRRRLKYSTSFLVVAIIIVIILIFQSILIPTTLLLGLFQFQLDESSTSTLTTSDNNINNHHHHFLNRLWSPNSNNKNVLLPVPSSSSSLAVNNNEENNNDNVQQPPIYSSWSWWLQYYYDYENPKEGGTNKQKQRQRRIRRIPPLMMMMLKSSTTNASKKIPQQLQVHNSWHFNLTRYVCGNIPIPPNSTVTIDITKESGCDNTMRRSMLVGNNNGNNDNNDNNSSSSSSSSIPILLLTSVYPYYGILKKQPPTTVRFEPTKQSNATPIDDDCDIPCHIQAVRPATIQFKGRIDGLPFVFDPISMEGAGYFTSFKVDPMKWKQNKYYATTSFDSDIILSYYLPFDTNLQSQPVEYNNDEEVLKRASFLAKNCESANSRERIVRLMINYYHTNPTKGIRIDSLSNCLANANLPSLGIMNRKNKTEILRKYMFHLAFENQRYNDYITEKLWHVLESGTLPIYYGPSNIRDHLPSSNSVILYDDFNNNPILLSKYLYKVANNQTLYESYHSWRKEPLDSKFIEKYNFTYTHATCRFCRWGYSRKYGLGWSQPKQQLMELYINRQTCISKTTGLIIRPFQEVLLLSSDNANDDNGDDSETKDGVNNDNDDDLDCAYSNNDDDNQLLPFYRRMNSYGKGWQRIVYDHDGVTDLRLIYIANRTATTTTAAAISNDRRDGGSVSSSDDSTTVLRLIMPIQSKKLYTPPPIINDEVQYWLQDDQSRITILLSRPLKVELKQQQKQKQTVLLINLPHNPTKQQTLKSSNGIHQEVVDLRLIVEDLDLFHKDATDYETYFGATMARDFFDPLDIIPIL